ncbi:helix-turn-helix domain-containing protein, partial [Sinorhizobium fredii]
MGSAVLFRHDFDGAVLRQLVRQKKDANQGPTVAGSCHNLDGGSRSDAAWIVESGLIPVVHGVVRWRLKDLVQWIFQEFRILFDETTVGCELKALGFAKLSDRPRHYAQNELEAATLKKTSPPRS